MWSDRLCLFAVEGQDGLGTRARRTRLGCNLLPDRAPGFNYASIARLNAAGVHPVASRKTRVMCA